MVSNVGKTTHLGLNSEIAEMGREIYITLSLSILPEFIDHICLKLVYPELGE